MWSRVLLGAVLMAGACNRVTYTNPGTMPAGPVTFEKGHFFLAGLIGEKEIWASRTCPAGVHAVQSRFTVVDVLLGGLTLLLYTPRTYAIQCAR